MRYRDMAENRQVTGAQLVSGIIGTIDIGSTIAKVIEYKIEEDRTKEQLDWIKWYIETYGPEWVKMWTFRAKDPPDRVVDLTKASFMSNFFQIANYARSQVLMAAGGFPATASMLGLRAKLYTALCGFSSETDIILGIPQSIAEQKARYYWNKTAPWRIPDPELAFKLHMEGQISRSEMNEFFAMNGWDTKYHDKLYNVFDTEPDIYTAFNMFLRNKISYDVLRSVFKAHGFDERWHDALYTALERIPSFYDLTRLADYVPLDPVWTSEILRMNGFRASDIPRLVTYLTLRPLREEVRNVAGRLVWEYENGRISRESLEAELKKLGLLPKELELWLLWSDKRYYDKVLDYQIDIIEQRVKKGNITDKEQIVKLLTELGIRKEIANLMAEKWYWQYLV